MSNLNECDDENIKRVLLQREKQKYYAEKRWYVVYVQPLHELQINDYLLNIEAEMKKRRRGKAKKEDLFVEIDPAKVRMECYVPTIPTHIKYSDRMIWKEKVQTPGMIFVHTALDDREPLFSSPISEYVTGFMIDREKHRPQFIPDAQMELFKKYVEAQFAISIGTPSLKVGERVLIVEGVMAGHVAELVGKKEVISKTEYETDRMGKTVVDAEGNPVPKHVVTLQIRLNSQLAANFEIDADSVIKAPKDARDFEAQD